MPKTTKDYVLVEGVIFPPNKPLEPRIEFSKTPVIYDSLFFLDFNENGNCIVGSSEVAGTFWEGTLLYFADSDCMKNFDYKGHYIYATTSDGKFIRNNIIALAEDTGNINILSVDADSSIRLLNYFKMIERIPQLCVWTNSSKILTCAERTIIIWDVDTLDRKPLIKFENYHSDRITSMDTLKNDTNLFISGARDRITCLWDLRSQNSASVLYVNEFSSISSVSWNQEDNNYVAIGTQAGDVYLLDKRQPREFVSVLHCFNSNINRISFRNSKEFAVCGDVNDVLIVGNDNCSLNILHKNSEHVGPVKDLKWHDDILYSCGFGKCIVKHTKLPNI